MTISRRVGSTVVIMGLSAGVPLAAQTAGSGATASSLRVGVLCMVSERSAFPFPAGTDRCFSAINGRMIEPRFSGVCLLETSSGPRLTFVYSAAPKPQCGGVAAYGNPATKAQYEPGLASLASREREFFLKNIVSAK